MSRDNPITRVMDSLAEHVTCHLCDTRLRFGDVECPHCGADVEEVLRQWAERLLSKLAPDSTIY